MTTEISATAVSALTSGPSNKDRWRCAPATFTYCTHQLAELASMDFGMKYPPLVELVSQAFDVAPPGFAHRTTSEVALIVEVLHEAGCLSDDERVWFKDLHRSEM